MSNSNWLLDAICRGKTNLFFAPRGERPDAKARREAAAFELCRQCPVSIPCREAAMTGDNGQPEQGGIWAGTTEEDRRLMVKL